MALAAVFSCATEEPAPPPVYAYAIYRRAADASAAAMLDDSTFVLADDEDNLLRIYRTEPAGRPQAAVDLSVFLNSDADRAEADLEGAARVGGRIYWISSHDTDKRGRVEAGRDCFFATDIITDGPSASIRTAGTPCRTLMSAFLASAEFEMLNRRIRRETTSQGGDKKRKKSRQDRSPLSEARFGIEGLCAAPDGRRLYIGFRRPIIAAGPDGPACALVVPLENPEEIIDGQAAPRFGEALLWDLDGLAIRGMECVGSEGAVYILAGAEKGDTASAVFRWDGRTTSQPARVATIDTATNRLTPESVVAMGPAGRLLILSDDGDVNIDVDRDGYEAFGRGRGKNKELTDTSQKRFRAFWVTTGEPAADTAAGQ